MNKDHINQDTPNQNIDIINIKRFNSHQINLVPSVSKQEEPIKEATVDKTDRSSEINRKYTNISKINLIKHDNLSNTLKTQLKMLNLPMTETPICNEKNTIEISQRDTIPTIIKENLIQFLINPLNGELWLKGKIVSSREHNNHILRYYLVGSEICNSDILVMFAKKIKRNQYELYANYNNDSSKVVPIGKLSTNMLGKVFKLKSFVSNNVIETIKYEFNIFGLNGPLKFKVETTMPNETGIQVFATKCPNYSMKYNCYVLNYLDRSIQSSIKNFQLISYKSKDIENDKDGENNDNSSTQDEDDKDEKNDEILLQFGEISSCSFALDFKAPFSPFQAFGIGISTIRNKLFCE